MDSVFRNIFYRLEDARVKLSTSEPHCISCSASFEDKDDLIFHLASSEHHNFCVACELDFPTPELLDAHIEYASVHRDDSDDEGDYHEDDESDVSDAAKLFAVARVYEAHESAPMRMPSGQIIMLPPIIVKLRHIELASHAESEDESDDEDEDMSNLWDSDCDDKDESA